MTSPCARSLNRPLATAFCSLPPGRNLRGSWVNEVSENRYENLRRLAQNYQFTVTKNDATDPAFYAEVPTFPAVLANPPFGLMERRKFDKIVTKKIDHWIILNALTRMQDDAAPPLSSGATPTTMPKDALPHATNQRATVTFSITSIITIMLLTSSTSTGNCTAVRVRSST